MIDFSPRAMMEVAIEQMRQSIAERRSDGKLSPKVGAVLIDVGDKTPPWTRISHAYRGELREGDHAEYTLLERKHRDRSLENCVLFATLEPCAPNSRKHPKLGCAERIVNARIKEVWIGIEDPDPTVDRKGIKYLQDNGITVHMFDSDLQDIIREENAEFLSQALERAESEKSASKDIVLSSLEAPQRHVEMDDLSADALERFSAALALSGASLSGERSSAINRTLVRLGLARQNEGKVTPTGFGSILFAKSPRSVLPQAGLLATIHFPNGKEEVESFDGPQVLVPDQVIEWLGNKLPNIIDRSGAERTEQNIAFFELIREGVVNALVHRDYDIAGAKCQLIVREHSIEIRSPGLPVSPIRIEQLQEFSAPTLSRNPALHYVFALLKLAEERGLGLKSLKQRTTSLGLPLPKFSWDEPYLTLTLFPTAASRRFALPEAVLSQLSEKELLGYEWIAAKGRVKSSDYSAQMGLDDRTGRRHLSRFVELGIARKSGSARSTEYEVN